MDPKFHSTQAMHRFISCALEAWRSDGWNAGVAWVEDRDSKPLLNLRLITAEYIERLKSATVSKEENNEWGTRILCQAMVVGLGEDAINIIKEATKK